MMTDAIRLEKLKFAYRDRGPTILDIETMVIPRGDKVFLHGPSGSGKTTLLGLVAGILPCQEGSVTVIDQPLQGMSGKERDQFRGEHIGYIFQQFNLIPYLNVRDNMTLVAKINAARRRRLEGRSIEQEAEELAGHLEIDTLLDKPVTELSVGQQQRVAAARALLCKPELIIADEPTSALDADRRQGFLDLLFAEATRAGSTILFVSHDRALADRFDRQVALSECNRATGGGAA